MTKASACFLKIHTGSRRTYNLLIFILMTALPTAHLLFSVTQKRVDEINYD